MPEKRKFICPCGKIVDYDNPNIGAINVGHFQQQTGWQALYDTFTYSPLWLCPICAKKAFGLAKELESVLGTDNINISSVTALEMGES